MNIKELFALFLRIVGVLGLMVIIRHSFLYAPTTVLIKAHLYILLKRVIGALVALYLIRGAPLLTKFAFPEKSGGSAQ